MAICQIVVSGWAKWLEGKISGNVLNNSADTFSVKSNRGTSPILPAVIIKFKTNLAPAVVECLAKEIKTASSSRMVKTYHDCHPGWCCSSKKLLNRIFFTQELCRLFTQLPSLPLFVNKLTREIAYEHNNTDSSLFSFFVLYGNKYQVMKLHGLSLFGEINTETFMDLSSCVWRSPVWHIPLS